MAGAHELAARSGPAPEWLVDRLQAPTRQWLTFEHSGHVPHCEEFGRFREALRAVMVALG